MKQILFGISCTLIMATAILVSMTVLGRMSRENELEQALRISTKQVLTTYMETGEYSAANEEEFAADFCQAVLEKISLGSEEEKDENFKITMEITGLDWEAGLISLHVTENFTYMNGRIGTIQKDITRVMEQSAEKPLCILTYEANGRTYKKYGVEKGRDFIVPKNPPAVGKNERFLYWMDEETKQRAHFPQTVSKDKQYIAVFSQVGYNMLGSN